MVDCFNDAGSLISDMTWEGYRVKVNVKYVDQLELLGTDDPCTDGICEGTDDDGETDEDHEDEPELPLEPIDKDQFTLILQWVTIGLTGALCLY